MNNKDSEETKSAARPTNQPTPGAPRRSRAGSVSSGLALILSIVALLASAYLGYTFIQKRGLYRADMFSRLNKLEDKSVQSHDALAAMAQQIGTLNETQDTLQAAVKRISGEFGKGRSEWLLAESEQLMLIANNQLQLAHDVTLALAALRAADQELQQLADPHYLPVRRALAREIGMLEALGQVDVPGMALRLGDIARHLNALPLATDTQQSTAPPTRPAAQTLSQAQTMWRDLVGLVRIRRINEDRRPLLPPDKEYFLRQNLRLMLYSAQTALLQGDAPVFDQDVNAAREWIKDYYDESAPAVKAVQTELDQMLNSPFRSRLPDISGSLEMLRRIHGMKAEP
ncbi:MAG: uroporphyrinogen-III C-methyltransferase [Acidiferrobacterales bacterium]